MLPKSSVGSSYMIPLGVPYGNQTARSPIRKISLLSSSISTSHVLVFIPYMLRGETGGFISEDPDESSICIFLNVCSFLSDHPAAFQMMYLMNPWWGVLHTFALFGTNTPMKCLTVHKHQIQALDCVFYKKLGTLRFTKISCAHFSTLQLLRHEKWEYSFVLRGKAMEFVWTS